MVGWLLATTLILSGTFGFQSIPGVDRFQDMKTIPVGPYVSVAKDGPGVVWSHTLTHSGPAATIRVHVSAPTLKRTPDWSIRFRDLAGKLVDTFQGDSPLLATGGIWSSEIAGNGAIVELVADAAGLRLEIAIDRYAYRDKVPIVSGPIGDPSVLDVIKAPLNVQNWAEPVARLRVIVESQQFTCTGFLVRPTLLLTAGYCARTGQEALSAIADFGLDYPVSTPRSFRVTKLEASSATLDYALLRLEAPPDGFVPARLATATAAPGEPLVLVHHAEGRAKQASIGCSVLGAQAGIQGGQTDFAHACVTGGGSGGSPIFGRDGLVVGLHHLGSAGGSAPKQAVQVSQIIEDLKQRSPELYSELMAPASRK